MKLRLGTRGSDLALTQSRWVAAELAKNGVETELEIISTSGDRSSAPTFGAIGPQGVFVREIEQALLDSRVDIAVHSCKDLPTSSPDGLLIAAIPPRHDVADWLLVRKGTNKPAAEDPHAAFGSLPTGARIGTASARRQAWIRYFRPELRIEPLRGNVPTRLNRLVAGDFDAILLAGAGIERLQAATEVLDAAIADVATLRLDPTSFVPAPAQGALAIQCRTDDQNVRNALTVIDDLPTRQAITIERQALALAEGGCDTAFGAYARIVDGAFTLSVMLERGDEILLANAQGPGDAELAETAMQQLSQAAERAG